MQYTFQEKLAPHQKLFLLGVMSMFFTLTRPSPYDAFMVISFILFFFENKKLSLIIIFPYILILIWNISVFVSYIDYFDRIFVTEYFAIGRVFGDARQDIIIKFYISMSSFIIAQIFYNAKSRFIDYFINFFIAAGITSSVLAIYGLIIGDIGDEVLTWAGRGKGLMDDPNMHSAFISVSALFCLYRIVNSTTKRTQFLYSLLFGVIALAVLLAYSRIATVNFIIFTSIMMFISSFSKPNAFFKFKYLFIFFAVAIVAFIITLSLNSDLNNLASQRFALTQSYDEGRGGRLNRYLLSLGYILQYPFGLGPHKFEQWFGEPIHNFFLSSFLNYGWLAGICWLSFVSLMIFYAIKMRKYANDTLFYTAILLGLLFQLSEALLHQTEHWRHMWMLIGIMWGLVAQSTRTANQHHKTVHAH